MPVKKQTKKIEVPLNNKALEFIQVTQESVEWFTTGKRKKKVIVKKFFVHYSQIQFYTDTVFVLHLGAIKETHKQITEAILKIGII